MTSTPAPQPTISPRPLVLPLWRGIRSSLCVPPVPPVSDASPRPKGVKEGGGGTGFNFFCPVAGRPKVGGRCTQNWWIPPVFLVKSLIAERYCLIKYTVFSIIWHSASIISPVLSIRPFSVFRPYISLFFFCKQRRRREGRGFLAEGGNPSIRSAAYFLVHQIDFAFRANGGCGGMAKPCAATVSGLIHQNPSIHQCFAPPPPEEVFL